MVLNRLNRLSSRYIAPLLVFGLVGMGGGAYLLIHSHAASLDTTADADKVVVEYNQGMGHVRLVNELTPAMTEPFRLYGNGLAICGHNKDMAMDMGGGNQMDSLTSATLTPAQIHDLVQKIADTGFLKLKPEYFKRFPIDIEQDILRLNLVSGDHFTAFYHDMAAPAPYTATAKIISDLCMGITTPYRPDNVKVRVADVTSSVASGTVTADTVTKAAPVNASTLLSQVSEALAKAAPPDSPQILSKAGAAASQIADALGGNRGHGFVKSGDKTYEVAVDKPLPIVANPLNINYAKSRSPDNSDTVHAASKLPVRTVLFLGSDTPAPSAAFQAQIKARGQAVYNWYCKNAGKCYTYQGFSVMRGAMPEANYLKCYDFAATPGSDQQIPEKPCRQTYDGTDYGGMEAVLKAVDYRDYNTVARSDVATQLITGFSTNTIRPICGISFLGPSGTFIDPYTNTYYTNDYLSVTDGVGSSYNSCSRPSTDMAHETGHMFGLDHSCFDYRDKNLSLMIGPPCSVFGNGCGIPGADDLIGNSSLSDGSPYPTICVLDPAQVKLLYDSGVATGNPGPALPPPPTPPYFYLRNTNTTGGADEKFTYGNKGDKPLECNWNGSSSGGDTVGLFRPSNATFYLRYSNTPGNAEVAASLGSPGDTPLCGDWDGNHTDTIAVYRPSNTTFYLRNSNTSGPSDVAIQFGNPGDIPIVGNWGGNGADGIGVFRPSTGTFYVRTNNGTVVPAKFGSPGDIPVIGDWDHTGVDKLGVYRPSNTTFYLPYTNGSINTFSYGVKGDIPVVGDWLGNGPDTIGVFRP